MLEDAGIHHYFFQQPHLFKTMLKAYIAILICLPLQLHCKTGRHMRLPPLQQKVNWQIHMSALAVNVLNGSKHLLGIPR